MSIELQTDGSKVAIAYDGVELGEIEVKAESVLNKDGEPSHVRCFVYYCDKALMHQQPLPKKPPPKKTKKSKQADPVEGTISPEPTKTTEED